MSCTRTLSVFLPLAAAALLASCMGGGSHMAGSPEPYGGGMTMEKAAPMDPETQAIVRATEKYKDVKLALADGYMADPSGMCVVASMVGAQKQLGSMGIHYFRPDLLGITGTEPRVNGTGTHTDFLKPAVLMYEPQADGSLVLVGIENLVWTKAWHDAGKQGRPTFRGNEYNYMIDNPLTPDVDEAHGFEAHYDLHWYLYRKNPHGEFMEFNPAVSCEHGEHAMK